MHIILLLHDGNLQWVFLYDSAFSGKTSEELDVQLALLYVTVRAEGSRYAYTTAKGSSDCGLFPAAIVLTIISGDDPAKVRWRQVNMRITLLRVLNQEVYSFFFTAKPESTSHFIVSLTIDIWCVCRLPQYAYKYMTDFEKCNR